MARGKSREKANIIDRQVLALDLRKSGKSFRAIATKLDISLGQAFKDVQKSLQESLANRNDDAEELRQLELDRLDDLTSALDHWVKAGSVPAANAMLRVMERRAKLLGLDAPTKQELKIDMSKLSDDELRAIAEE